MCVLCLENWNTVHEKVKCLHPKSKVTHGTFFNLLFINVLLEVRPLAQGGLQMRCGLNNWIVRILPSFQLIWITAWVPLSRTLTAHTLGAHRRSTLHCSYQPRVEMYFPALSTYKTSITGWVILLLQGRHTNTHTHANTHTLTQNRFPCLFFAKGNVSVFLQQGRNWKIHKFGY